MRSLPVSCDDVDGLKLGHQFFPGDGLVHGEDAWSGHFAAKDQVDQRRGGECCRPSKRREPVLLDVFELHDPRVVVGEFALQLRRPEHDITRQEDAQPALCRQRSKCTPFGF